MTSTRKPRIPRLTRHKATGQAVVRLSGKDHYCGRFGTAAARAEYDRLLERWLAGGRRPLEPDTGHALVVEEVIAAYWRHAEQHYRGPDGEPTSELACIRLALGPLRRLYGETPAADFGPRALHDLREAMCRETTRFGKAPARRTVNGYVRRIKAAFKWAVARELVPPSVYQGLRAVDGLRAGRSAARETRRVQPVEREHVGAALPHLSRQLRAIVELMWLTGMRVGEVVAMSTGRIDRTGPTWEYRPETHKTAHHGRERVVALGPRAQEVILPFLRADPAAPLFSPHDAERERLERRREGAEAPLTDEQRVRRRAEAPSRRPGTRYTTDAVRRAITRACKLAGVPHWHPHQLRHTAGTRFRREAGLEAARVLLGHSSPVVTEEHYAEVDRRKAHELMAALG